MMFPKVQQFRVPRGSRIVLLGDPHGDVRTAQRILERERAVSDATTVVCVGDAIGYADGPTSSLMVDWLEMNGVPTVLGNHEEWYFHQNQLSVVEDRRADRLLSESAVRWISDLPHRIDLCATDSDDILGTIVHSIRTPQWDDIQPHSASRILREVRGVRLIFAGHSHCARVLKEGADGAVVSAPFDFNAMESYTVSLSGVSRAIVDAGSIGRPRTDLRQFDRVSNFGTYAVVDLKLDIVELRRIDRRAA